MPGGSAREISRNRKHVHSGNEHSAAFAAIFSHFLNLAASFYFRRAEIGRDRSGNGFSVRSNTPIFKLFLRLNFFVVSKVDVLWGMEEVDFRNQYRPASLVKA